MTSVPDIWLKLKSLFWQIPHSFDSLVLLTSIPSENSTLSKYKIYNIQTFPLKLCMTLFLTRTVPNNLLKVAVILVLTNNWFNECYNIIKSQYFFYR